MVRRDTFSTQPLAARDPLAALKARKKIDAPPPSHPAPAAPAPAAAEGEEMKEEKAEEKAADGKEEKSEASEVKAELASSGSSSASVGVGGGVGGGRGVGVGGRGAPQRAMSRGGLGFGGVTTLEGTHVVSRRVLSRLFSIFFSLFLSLLNFLFLLTFSPSLSSLATEKKDPLAALKARRQADGKSESQSVLRLGL
jgi:hypothetical protein